jgi:prepilin-type N-terminal cleavage/methylation domain-containing protein
VNRAEARAGERGMTLIELLVAMTLLGVVSSLVVVGVQNATRTLTHTDDENRGLQDAKVILDRLSRDVRQARGVVCDDAPAAAGDPVLVPFDHDSNPATPTVLVHARCPDYVQLWIDTDSDYLPDGSEVVTWQLAPNEDGEHFDVWRCQGALAQGDACDGNSTGVQRKRQASALIVRTLFAYEDNAGNAVQPEAATLVRLKMDYDAIVGRGVNTKQATVSARLRNKG